jgi:hypothetical protein
MKRRASVFAFFLVVAIGAASQYAAAVSLRVDCDKHESISKVVHLLAKANPQGPNTITVSGDCKGNFLIKGMDRLTLITRKGASITDSSNGSLAVVDIEDSQKVTLQGFTINGGAQGILCNTASLCYLTGNTIQGPGRFGVNVIRGSRAFRTLNAQPFLVTLTLSDPEGGTSKPSQSYKPDNSYVNRNSSSLGYSAKPRFRSA